MNLPDLLPHRVTTPFPVPLEAFLSLGMDDRLFKRCTGEISLDLGVELGDDLLALIRPQIEEGRRTREIQVFESPWDSQRDRMYWLRMIDDSGRMVLVPLPLTFGFRVGDRVHPSHPRLEDFQGVITAVHGGSMDRTASIAWDKLQKAEMDPVITVDVLKSLVLVPDDRLSPPAP